jgi:hypothetical protein
MKLGGFGPLTFWGYLMNILPAWVVLLFVALCMDNPEWVAQWVFDYNNALFELQYQAAEETMR